MEDWKCTACGYIFNVKVENPEFGIDLPYDFEDLPEDWVCPVCGVSKSEFRVCKK
ncbi:MAG: rubredoxin [Actinobacteria bacterium]|nr:rubredoxin [Actinomycetota bacterium]